MFTEILENVSFVFIWNTISWLSYLILNTCETYISEPLIRAYVQSASMIYIYSFILMESRIFIFEHLYKDVKYISNRKDEGEIYRLYDKSQFLLWSTLGTGFFYNQTFSFSILSVDVFFI